MYLLLGSRAETLLGTVSYCCDLSILEKPTCPISVRQPGARSRIQTVAYTQFDSMTPLHHFFCDPKTF
jgi:hypothetical protein